MYPGTRGVPGKRNWPEIALEPARPGLLGSTSLSTDSSDDAGSDDSNDARRTNSKAYSTAGNSGTGNSIRMDNTRSSLARTQPRSTLAHRTAGLKQMPIPLPPV